MFDDGFDFMSSNKPTKKKELKVSNLCVQVSFFKISQ